MPDPDDQVDRTDGAVVPSASAVYAVAPAMNLRAAYSYTLARPRFREVAPFLFTDYTRGINISGNPDLEQSRIHNADLRWEWFAGQTELLAASLFYKRFRDPIETVVVSASGGDVSFANAAGATAIGSELEARVSLGRIHPALDVFRIWSNATLTRSRIELRDEQIGSQTSAERPLQGQAPYVVNVGATWNGGPTEVTALYNVVGRRIQEVGFDTLPDTYQQPMHQVDVAASQRLGGGLTCKLGAQNLLNQPLVLVQGPIEVYRMRPGVAISAALEWAP
jgi:outer membrane receptor protein involved in Fe transport